MLEYKGDIYGCEVRDVDRFFPSSKRCSNCGYINEELTLTIREWECPECKSFWDRDVNAALNLILFSESKNTPGIRVNLRLNSQLKDWISLAVVGEVRKPRT